MRLLGGPHGQSLPSLTLAFSVTPTPICSGQSSRCQPEEAREGRGRGVSESRHPPTYPARFSQAQAKRTPSSVAPRSFPS